MFEEWRLEDAYTPPAGSANAFLPSSSGADDTGQCSAEIEVKSVHQLACLLYTVPFCVQERSASTGLLLQPLLIQGETERMVSAFAGACAMKMHSIMALAHDASTPVTAPAKTQLGCLQTDCYCVPFTSSCAAVRHYWRMLLTIII